MAPPYDRAAQEDSAVRSSSPSAATDYDAIENNNGKKVTDSPESNTLSTSESDRSCSNNNNNKNNGSSSYDPPSNEYVLNVAFVSFVGFMLLQSFFAIIANSESMLADSEAMSVDAMTYLFNMWAERVKNRRPTQEELSWPLAVREHRIEMKRLYLELIPPLISVTTLIAVTISALKEAFATIVAEDPDHEVDVSAGLMLFFSGLNLLLDVLNVTCFARAQQAYGLQKTAVAPPLGGTVAVTNGNHKLRNSSSSGYNASASERAYLLSSSKENGSGECYDEYEYDDYDEEKNNNFANVQGSSMAVTDHTTHDSYFESIFGNVNLNMCSAWTHICADTMRSAAVLIAASIAKLFDSVSPAKADSAATIAVCVTILISLIPLLRGLFVTARQIVIERKNKPGYDNNTSVDV